MAKLKYEKHFITDCIRPKPEKFGSTASDGFTLEQVPKIFPTSKLTCAGRFFLKPTVEFTGTHVHEFDEWLIFLGTNFMNMSEFDAVIELSMGEEEEQHLITQPTVVYIPAGLVHGPLNFAVVNKPVLFFHPRHV